MTEAQVGSLELTGLRERGHSVKQETLRASQFQRYLRRPRQRWCPEVPKSRSGCHDKGWKRTGNQTYDEKCVDNELMNVRAEGGQCAEIMEGVDLEWIREYNDIVKQEVQAMELAVIEARAIAKEM